MREKKPNTATIRWDADTMRNLLEQNGLAPIVANALVEAYEAKREAGPDKACQAIIYHGPGHQSWSYCEAQGNHYGEHYAEVMGRIVEWKTPKDPSMPAFARDL